MKKGNLLFLILICTAVAVLFVMLYSRLFRGVEADIGEYEIYDRHYMLIPGDDAGLWDEVYESALAEGREHGAYVELFGENMTVSYDRYELLKLAIQASPDGIIVFGDESGEAVELIDEAVDGGIPVITVLEDCSGSRRQCFVGYNNYNLGQEYGGRILHILSEESTETEEYSVTVLLDDSRVDTGQNLILLGIRETLERELGEDTAVSVNTYQVDSSRSFSSEESIRDIFLGSKELPDILVCLSELNTRCAYQAVVDYNQVGEVRILGYYDSDTIVEAIAKGIIDSTITLDTAQLGKFTVDALEEYIASGYTNSYLAVDTRIITEEDARLITESTGAAA